VDIVAIYYSQQWIRICQWLPRIQVGTIWNRKAEDAFRTSLGWFGGSTAACAVLGIPILICSIAALSLVGILKRATPSTLSAGHHAAFVPPVRALQYVAYLCRPFLKVFPKKLLVAVRKISLQYDTHLTLLSS
jgi:hypothetical protein